jgi:hypothetical protein
MAVERFAEHAPACESQYRQSPFGIEVTVTPGTWDVPAGKTVSVTRVDRKAGTAVYPAGQTSIVTSPWEARSQAS